MFCTAALPHRPSELDATLTAVLADLPAHRRRLQKTLPLTNGHWPWPGPFLRYDLRRHPPGPQ